MVARKRWAGRRSIEAGRAASSAIKASEGVAIAGGVPVEPEVGLMKPGSGVVGQAGAVAGTVSRPARVQSRGVNAYGSAPLHFPGLGGRDHTRRSSCPERRTLDKDLMRKGLG